MPPGIYPRVLGVNVGHPVSEETKRKISQKLKGRKSPNWKDGRTQGNEYYKEYQKRWRKTNSKKRNFWSKQRKFRLKEVGGSHTLGERETLMAQYNWTCPCCEKSEPEIKLTEDHIIPLSLGGSNNIENIQPLCRTCNSRKHTKIIKFNEEVSKYGRTKEEDNSRVDGESS